MSSDQPALQAWLFDLDGVVTDTAAIHGVAWKALFDRFLEHRAGGGEYVPLKLPDDYLEHIDGKPRYEGVRDFLASRGVTLPWGTSDDGPGFETFCSVGNMKNDLFNEILDRDGVPVFEGAVRLLDHLKAAGIKTACVSSSRNCRPVLKRSSLDDRFDTVIDGIDLETRNIRGKPEPEAFLTAAKELGVAAENAVVLEDALAGVEAGKRGDFGLVVGIDRGAGRQALLDGGADVVVEDAGELLDQPAVMERVR